MARVSAILVVGTCALGCLAERAEMVIQAQQSCAALMGVQRWEDWDDAVGCRLARVPPRDCPTRSCTNFGCHAVAPCSGRLADSLGQEGTNQSYDGDLIRSSTVYLHGVYEQDPSVGLVTVDRTLTGKSCWEAQSNPPCPMPGYGVRTACCVDVDLVSGRVLRAVHLEEPFGGRHSTLCPIDESTILAGERMSSFSLNNAGCGVF